MTKVAVAGCAGRMGKRIVCALEGSSKVELGAGFERKDHADVGKDAGINAGIPEKGVKIEDSPGAAKACRVLIDFTVPEALPENLKYCEANNINLVIGTTGLSDDQKKALKAASDKIGVVFAPNMGVGINVLLNVVKNIAATLGDNYDIEIIEAHHNKKKDSPSGSALGLAEAVAKGRGLSVKDHAVYGRQGAVGARKKDEIGIHAIRGGDIIGEHTVLFSGAGEKIAVSHSVITRDVFAKGAVRAAEFLLDKDKGFYNMQDVLGLAG